MTESKVYADGFSCNFKDPDEFLQFLWERKENSSWIKAPSRSLHFKPIEKGSTLGNLYMQIYEHDGRGEILADTMENTSLLVKVNDKDYPVRSCALKTILERARISGHALNKVSTEVFTQILNCCMDVASGDSLVKIADEKVSAVHGGDPKDYYTDFYLQAAPVTEDQFHSIDSALQELRSMREAYFDDGTGYWENTEDTWYQSFDDMVEVSRHFPEVTFTLTGYGDQRDDQWIDYFKNGQVQCCSIYTLQTPLRPHRWSDVEKDEHGHYRQTLKLTAKEREHDSLQLDVYQCLLSLSVSSLQFDPEQLDRGAKAIAAFLEGEGLAVNKTALGGYPSPVEEVSHEG